MARPSKAYPFDGLEAGSSIKLTGLTAVEVGRIAHAAYRRRRAEGGPRYEVRRGEDWVVVHRAPE